MSQSKQMSPEFRLRGTLRELQAVPRGVLHALQLAGQRVPAAGGRSGLEPAAHQGTQFAGVETALGLSSERVRALAPKDWEAAAVIGKKWLPTARGAAGALGGSHAATCWASDHDRKAGWTFYGLT